MQSNFLWGGASSACQMEGAYLEGNKSLSIADIMTVGGKKKPRQIRFDQGKDEFYPSHDAIDFYHKYKEDIQVLKELGLKSYRFSISWTRIYPNPEDEIPNEEGLKFYDEVIDLCLENNIEPIITLLHLDTPLVLVEKYGSWTNRIVVDLFIKYSETVIRRYKDKVKYWMTFNEINHAVPKSKYDSVLAFVMSGVNYEPFENKEQAVADSIYHMLLATAKVVKLAHNIKSDLKVSIMNAMIPIYPATCHPDDMMQSILSSQNDFYILDTVCRGEYPKYKLLEYERKNITLPIIGDDLKCLKEGTVDYIAYSYYMSNVVSGKKDDMKILNAGFSFGVPNPYLEKTEWGFVVDPVGLRYSLNLLYNRYQLPIMIVENGIGLDEKASLDMIQDDYRIDFLRKHIEQLKLAIEVDGVNCIGYYVWTPIDLVSGSSGEMEKRYGLVYVDLDNMLNGTGKRIPKKSYYWYKRVIESNGSNLE